MFPMLLQLITHEDGYYALTKSGNVVLIALVALLVIVAILAMTRKDKDTDLRTIRITVSAISLALAFVTSFFRLFDRGFERDGTVEADLLQSEAKRLPIDHAGVGVAVIVGFAVVVVDVEDAQILLADLPHCVGG